MWLGLKTTMFVLYDSWNVSNVWKHKNLNAQLALSEKCLNEKNI